MTTIEPGIYEHFKGQRYRVLGLCHHSETEEPLVVYQALYGERGLWVRPLDNFLETVTVDGEPMPRFERIQALSESDWLSLAGASAASSSAVSSSGSSNSEV